MNLAIMQPYFFPYLGYFHLLKAVDKFVIYDDVNFINRGWVNRNRIPINGEARYFTIPLSAASQNEKINQIRVVEDFAWKKKMFQTFDQVYAKAPFKKNGLEILGSVLDNDSTMLVDYCVKSITQIATFLGIECEIISSSHSYDNSVLKSEDRIIDICIREKADKYINLMGGRDLYISSNFTAKGCELNFIKSNLPPYSTVAPVFIPGLSILDIVMNCEKDHIKQMLNEYNLLSSEIAGD